MSFRVLHIEDDPTQALIIKRLLEKHLSGEDYMYCSVQSLAEAREKLEEGCLDIALVDLSLPDGRGTASVSAVNVLCPDIPIVVLTGEDSLAVAKDAIQAGADAYVKKTDLQTLPLVMLLTAERYHLKQELQSKCDLYNSVVDISPDFIIRFRPDGTITFANKTTCEVVHRTPEEVIGTNLSQYMKDKFLQLHNDKVSLLTVENPVSESLETKFGDRWVLWRKVGLFDAQGRLYEIQTIGRDVTYRHKQAEEFLALATIEVQKMKEALAKSTERTHQILNENVAKIAKLERG